MIKKVWPIFAFLALILIFFWQFFLKGLLPIAADTIVGLYYPYRDLYSKNYPNGIPYKNFLITDPVREQYLWKKFSIDSLKKNELPLWNPYSFSGTPNLANFQSGAFYPLNLIFILPYNFAWSIFIILEPFLAGIFLYIFLRNLKLSSSASFFGGLVFAFSGFFTSWLEWGNILHTALWLPLILLSIDKISGNRKWSVVLVFSLASSFFAGHLQTFFYLFLVSFLYFIFRFWPKKEIRFLGTGLISFILFLIIAAPQILPTLKLISLSERALSEPLWQQSGWFIPWQNLVQALIPDFFGNPSTLNYWGVWNYGELTVYAGIIPLIFAIFALLGKREREIKFFVLVLLFALIFSLQSFISIVPYKLNIPFLSTSQPTRLIFLIDFCIAVLGSFGLFKFQKNGHLKILFPLGVIAALFTLIFISLSTNSFNLDLQNLAVAKRNFIFPFAVFLSSGALILIYSKFNKNLKQFVLILLILITVIDLFRFSWKFNTFSKEEYLFPKTGIINFLQKNLDNFRIATTDARIFPPNFSIYYHISSIEGYDPLFLKTYAEFISAVNRGKPDISPPFGFNRIVRVENLDSKFLTILGVKYFLSFSDQENKSFQKVYQEGQTKVFENTKVLPKAFLAEKLKNVKSKEEAINILFNSNFNPQKDVVVQNMPKLNITGKGIVKILKYESNMVEISTETEKEEVLVLSDIYYSSWKAKLEKGRELKIYSADYIYRGVIIPPGKNKIIFYNSLL